jgi:hypothetical protein
MDDLLGGALRRCTRPRGFIEDWRPQKQNLKLLDQVRGVQLSTRPICQ